MIVRLFRGILHGKHVEIDYEHFKGEKLISWSPTLFKPCKILRCASLKIDGNSPPEYIQTQLQDPDLIQDTYGEWAVMQESFLHAIPRIYYRLTRLNLACRERTERILQAARHYDSETFSSELKFFFDDLFKWVLRRESRCRLMISISRRLREDINDPVLEKIYKDISNIEWRLSNAVLQPQGSSAMQAEQRADWEEWEDEGTVCYARDVFGPQITNWRWT